MTWSHNKFTPSAVFLPWAFFLMMAPQQSRAQTVATVEDPDGWTYVRAGTDTKAEIMGRVKNGERMFLPTGDKVAGWQQVITIDGRYGYVHSSRVKSLKNQPFPRMTYTEASLVRMLRSAAREYGDSTSGKAEGQKYQQGVLEGFRRAGSARGLTRVLVPGATIDGAVAEGHDQIIWAVLHAWGDEKFAEAIPGLTAEHREWLREVFRTDGAESNLPIEKPMKYMKAYFPMTLAKLQEK